MDDVIRTTITIDWWRMAEGLPNTRRSWWVSGGTHSSGLITDPTMLEEIVPLSSAYVGRPEDL